jgi:hypothetical protein
MNRAAKTKRNKEEKRGKFQKLQKCLEKKSKKED